MQHYYFSNKMNDRTKILSKYINTNKIFNNFENNSNSYPELDAFVALILSMRNLLAISSRAERIFSSGCL